MSDDGRKAYVVIESDRDRETEEREKEAGERNGT